MKGNYYCIVNVCNTDNHANLKKMKRHLSCLFLGKERKTDEFYSTELTVLSNKLINK